MAYQDISSAADWGVHHTWLHTTLQEQCTTEKGTVVEMIHRPRWGVACYMNGEIQSCERDESLYHETLVHPAMIHTMSAPRRILLLGGGEGATAREVLRWPSVERVDMYEWDEEVTTLFRTRYPQWAKGAWEDPRLVLHHKDVFEVIQEGVSPPVPYDVIVVDLFEPSREEGDRMWVLFTRLASHWLSEGGSLVMYSGIRNPFHDVHPAEEWLTDRRVHAYEEHHHLPISPILEHRNIYSYKVFVPSFLGEAMFLLLTPSSTPSMISFPAFSPVTPDRWRAYHTWNPYGREEEQPDGVFQGV
jgi:spermidine synthase